MENIKKFFNKVVKFMEGLFMLGYYSDEHESNSV